MSQILTANDICVGQAVYYEYNNQIKSFIIKRITLTDDNDIRISDSPERTGYFIDQGVFYTHKIDIYNIFIEKKKKQLVNANKRLNKLNTELLEIQEQMIEEC